MEDRQTLMEVILLLEDYFLQLRGLEELPKEEIMEYRLEDLLLVGRLLLVDLLLTSIESTSI